MDLVMDIDLTGSMSPFLNTVKACAQRLVDLIGERMEDAGKSIDRLRVCVIGFRDYKYDGKDSMVESPIFELPQDNEAFQNFVNGLEATGGGDAPESALEALALAAKKHQEMRLPDTNRNVTVIFSDTNAHALHDPERTKNPLYPEDMPKDIAELSACLCCSNQSPYTMPDKRSARLLLFTPQVEPWTSLATLPYTWHLPTKLDAGLSDQDENAIADLVAQSVAV